MSDQEFRVHLDAPPAAVYRALTDGAAVATWMVPDTMSSEVHAFDAREGGAFRISLTYDAPDARGKSGGNTDTFAGRFLRLVPDAEVVQAITFDTEDAAMKGEMIVSYRLSAAGGGTELVARHDGVPPGVRPEDNELGWTMSLGKLKRLVEGA